MVISPTFWVAFSFIIFIIFAWSFIRSAFLNAIHDYKTSIASNLSDLYAEKNQSEELLERSIKELSESASNVYVLNAHRVAKTIAEQSKERIAYINRTVNADLKASVSGFEIFMQNKVKIHILSLTSALVEKYIYAHPKEFNKIAMAKTKEIFMS